MIAYKIPHKIYNLYLKLIICVASIFDVKLYRCNLPSWSTN